MTGNGLLRFFRSTLGDQGRAGFRAPATGLTPGPTSTTSARHDASRPSSHGCQSWPAGDRSGRGMRLGPHPSGAHEGLRRSTSPPGSSSERRRMHRRRARCHDIPPDCVVTLTFRFAAILNAPVSATERRLLVRCGLCRTVINRSSQTDAFGPDPGMAVPGPLAPTTAFWCSPPPSGAHGERQKRVELSSSPRPPV